MLSGPSRGIRGGVRARVRACHSFSDRPPELDSAQVGQRARCGGSVLNVGSLTSTEARIVAKTNTLAS